VREQDTTRFFAIPEHEVRGICSLDVERNRVLWVCATREKDAVVDVFRNVSGKEVCEGIEAVSMDRWPAYEEAVKECLPNAQGRAA